jgi:hypothetical protein
MTRILPRELGVRALLMAQSEPIAMSALLPLFVQ